ncbi:undecaprenyl diphosphate synthase family protein [Aspergillus mulundensis]|uniref:Alkyl transferase n=1 Tax=Aspergillus mulundensis TaxID=1810919 RepID=A0A3D8SWC3_9EURO|nr:hypothetical protein DSM5745_02334 [Aspergillus mulundensis]RDW90559.1 hypothetical protein DSM5745_02334 [Aspergillus mulundensis]
MSDGTSIEEMSLPTPSDKPKPTGFHPMAWISSSLQEIITEGLQQSATSRGILRHIACELDGNRRWARSRGVPVSAGHRQGAETMTQIVETAFGCGVQALTLYIFSIENFKRSADEIQSIMAILADCLSRLSDSENGLARRQGFAIRVLGNLKLLDDDMQAVVRRTVESTKDNGARTLNFCIAYTSRYEITAAVRKTVIDACATRDKQDPTTISVDDINANMMTADCPPVDLLIRTSGTTRLSDFFMWQCNGSTDIVFTQTLWPEFGPLRLLFVIWKWQNGLL